MAKGCARGSVVSCGLSLNPLCKICIVAASKWSNLMPPTFPFYTWPSRPDRAFSNPAAVFTLLSLSCAAASPLDISQSNYFTGFLHSTPTLTPNADRVCSFLRIKIKIKINTLSPKGSASVYQNIINDHLLRNILQSIKYKSGFWPS